MADPNRIEYLRAKLAAMPVGQRSDTEAAIELAEAGWDDEAVTEGLCHARTTYHDELGEAERVSRACERGCDRDLVESWVREGDPRAELAVRMIYFTSNRLYDVDPHLLLKMLPFFASGDQGMVVDHLSRHAQEGRLPADAFGPLIARVRAPSGCDFFALKQLGPHLPAEVIPMLAGRLSCTEDLVSLAAAQLLASVVSKSLAAVPALRGVLRGDAWFAIEVLGALPRAIGAAAVPLLAELLTDPFFRREGDDKVRLVAARALRYLEHGAETAGAVLALRAALEDPDAAVRGAAAEALVALASPASA